MEYDENRIEYVIQMSEHLYICIYCVVRNDMFLKTYFFIIS